MQIRGAAGVFILVFIVCVIFTGGHLYSPDEEIMFRVTESMATRLRLDVDPILDANGRGFATRRGLDGREYAQYGLGNSLVAVPLYWLGTAVGWTMSDATLLNALKFQTTLYAPEEVCPGQELLRRLAVSLTGALVAAATSTLLFLFCRNLGRKPRRKRIEPSPEPESSRDDTESQNGDQIENATVVKSLRIAADAEMVPSETHPGKRESGGYPTKACWIVAVAYGLGTMALPHSRTFFSEPLATFFVLLTFYLLAIPTRKMASAAEPITAGRAALAGAAFALALLTRLDSLFAAAGIGLLFISRLPQEPGWVESPSSWLRSRVHRHSFVLAGAFGGPVIAFGILQLGLNWLHFGSPLATAYADQPEGINFSTPLLAGLYGFLFSVGKSIFLFSPAILLGILGFSQFRRQWRALANCLAISAGCVLLVHSSWQNWAGGWCWGPRHIFMIHALLILPAIAFVSQQGFERRIFAEAVILVAFLVQAYGSSQSFIDYYVLYYRTPFTAPNAHVLYGPEDLASSFIRATAAVPDSHGQTMEVPIPLTMMPAPISDSIYLPQNSQWYRYAEMWDMGFTDNLWLRLVQRSRGKEAIIQ